MNGKSIARTVAVIAAAVTVSGSLAFAQAAQAAPADARGQSAVSSTRTAAAPTSAQGTQGTAPGAKTGGASVNHLDGYCHLYANGTGDVCLYYLSNFVGSLADFYSNDSNLWNNYFLSPGAGQGSVVANNAESVWNRDLIYTAYLCVGTNYTAPCGWVAPGAYGNLNSTYKNNVESLYWV